MDYAQRGVEVVAINIEPRYYLLDEWISFWKTTGAGDVVWAQDAPDIESSALQRYRLLALGTEVLIDREGRVAFRSDGPSGLRRLRAEIEKLP